MTLIIKKISELTPEEKNELYLFCSYELNYKRSHFDTIIKQVDEIYLKRDGQTQLQACCCITYKKITINNRKKLLIKANLVCISVHFRGGCFLEKIGFRTLLQAKLKHPFASIYYVSVIVSPIAYLLMSNAFSEYYPKKNHPPTSDIEEIVAAVSKGPFERRYHNAIFNGSGLQSLSNFKCHAKLSPHKQEKYDFFICQNPYFRQGDGLVSIVPLTSKNVIYLTRQYIKKLCSKIKKIKFNKGEEVNGLS